MRKHADNVANVGQVSPAGRNPTSNGSVHGDVGLRPSVVSVPNHEADNPTCGTQLDESAKLEKAIKANLKGLGYGG